MDAGVLAGMAVLVLLFEAVPGTSLGRLAGRTVDEEMQGYDPGEIYEVPPELPEESRVDVEEVFRQELPDVVQPDQVLSLAEDTTGLETVGTVDINVDGPAPQEDPDEGIPEPGTFVPHSTPPVCTFRPVPSYPEMAREAGIEGRVVLMMFVSEEGEPLEIDVAQSSGLGSMDDAAVEAAMRSSWSPARRDDGVAVGVWTSVVYEFVLE